MERLGRLIVATVGPVGPFIQGVLRSCQMGILFPVSLNYGGFFPSRLHSLRKENVIYILIERLFLADLQSLG
jgi:hypothetical protein